MSGPQVRVARVLADLDTDLVAARLGEEDAVSATAEPVDLQPAERARQRWAAS
jgi:hypothetical protein